MKENFKQEQQENLIINHSSINNNDFSINKKYEISFADVVAINMVNMEFKNNKEY